MAVVLSSEETNFFASSTLRRSHSQPKFIARHGGFRTSSSTSHLHDNYTPSSKSFADSAPSSAPSSPAPIQAESTDLSYSSTPASHFSLASDCEEDDPLGSVTSDDRHVLPHYDDIGFDQPTEDPEPLPSPPRTSGHHAAPPPDADTSSNLSRPESPVFLDRAEDDLALRTQPSRHVDYLSHNWREEDIWSSWKHIITRRSEYNNSARLENASWRTWVKAKNKLNTVSPETLNWHKDCDVTWLYGPLQTGTRHLDPTRTDLGSGSKSKSNTFKKKPILKKRSMSEVMLQRSLSSSSLVKQAAAAVQAQQDYEGRPRPALERAITDVITLTLSSRRGSNNQSCRWSSMASSGFISPSGEQRHIHFNEQVAQCIALDVKGDEDDDDQDTDRNRGDSDDSDDGAIMMKRVYGRKKRPIPAKKAKNVKANTGESKTIAMLPSTTLKYREDTPEPHESALKHSVFRSPAISPCSSQETLRPSRKSGKLFMDTDEEGEEEEGQGEHASSTSGWRSPTKHGEGSTGLQRSTSSASLCAEPVGMRRTPSGMFMPYEDGDASSTNEGIFGRVIDTVNTARDIAHVIWNVGWKK